MNERKVMGLKIREIRKKAKLTQEQFCERIKIEPTSLSNIENGKSFPSMQTVVNILKEFEILPQDFFDTEYLKKETELESEMCDIIKDLPTDKKRIIYRIIKSFDI